LAHAATLLLLAFIARSNLGGFLHSFFVNGRLSGCRTLRAVREGCGLCVALKRCHPE
jgi:hypothetical protein